MSTSITDSVYTINTVKDLTKLDLDLDSQHVQFAKIQLALGVAAKEAATNLMVGIEESQALQKECQDMLTIARNHRLDAGERGDKGYLEAPKEFQTTLADYASKYNIDLQNKDNDWKYSEAEMDYIIEQLSARLEQLGANTQTQMVQVNDYMAQYNSYMQAANKAITDGYSTMSKVFGG